MNQLLTIHKLPQQEVETKVLVLNGIDIYIYMVDPCGSIVNHLQVTTIISCDKSCGYIYIYIYIGSSNIIGVRRVWF